MCCTEWRWIFRLPVLLMLAGGIVFYPVARERPQDMGFEPLSDTGVANAADRANEADHADQKPPGNATWPC